MLLALLVTSVFPRRVLHFKPKLITQQTQLLLKRALAPRDAFINAAKSEECSARAQKLSALQPPPPHRFHLSARLKNSTLLSARELLRPQLALIDSLMNLHTLNEGRAHELMNNTALLFFISASQD
jgi:hypothetical protein